MTPITSTVETAYLGIEIGGTKLQIVLGSSGAKILRRWRYSVNPAEGGAGIRQYIEKALSEILPLNPNLLGIGVGFGGPVDRQMGRIACSHQIGGWSGFDIKGWLRSLSPIPVHIDNDANTAALGEAVLGAGKTFDPVFYITMGSGVGGGLVTDGKIYHGATPGEAEIGHVRLDRQGTTIESRCSGWAVDGRIRELKTTQPMSLIARMASGSDRGEARFLADACAQGDSVALNLLKEVAEDLALGLSHVTHLFHPEAIVLGGGLSLAGEPFREAVAAALPHFLMDVFKPGPNVVLAGLGEDSVPVGALLLAQMA
jgi:glucokinase